MNRLFKVPGNAKAASVEEAKADLGGSVAVVGSHTEPGKGLRVVHRNTLTLQIHLAQRVLRDRIALVGQRPPEAQRGCIVATPIRDFSVLVGSS